MSGWTSRDTWFMIVMAVLLVGVLSSALHGDRRRRKGGG